MWADVLWGDAGAAEPPSPQDPYEAAIRDEQAGLADRFGGVLAWFGRSTLQWWGVAGGELVTAPSAEELADLLDRVLGPPSRWPFPARDLFSIDVRAGRVAGREPRPGGSAPRARPGRAHPFGLSAQIQPAALSAARDAAATRSGGQPVPGYRGPATHAGRFPERMGAG